nr:hypothetical protein [Actinomycetota bacterium]
SLSEAVSFPAATSSFPQVSPQFRRPYPLRLLDHPVSPSTHPEPSLVPIIQLPLRPELPPSLTLVAFEEVGL